MSHPGDARYRARIGTQTIDLPIVELREDLAVALLISVDLGIEFCIRAGQELADALRDLDVEVVASIATMGIPFAIEVARALGHDQYVVLHKTPKIHLKDAVAEQVRSITTDAPQRLLFDRARVGMVAGRRVAVIDDVISTGSSVAAALRLLRRVDAAPVAIGTVATEGDAWRGTLGADAALVRSLASLPLFQPAPGGGYVPAVAGSDPVR